jgi:protocatechuate 3,4-dioxygenase beta subunit
MISSGIKRGLATTAVSALAVAGLPLLASSASAVTLANSVASADAVVIAGPQAATVSTKNDGRNQTFRLEALGGNNVQSVRFEYSIGDSAETTVIATVSRNDNGAFSYEWNAAGLNGAALNLTATGLNAAGTAISTSDEKTVTVNNANETVNVADGNAIGVFQKPDYDGAGTNGTPGTPATPDDPATPADETAAGTPGTPATDNPDTAAQNVIVSGTSSAPGATPTLQFWDGDTNGATAGNPSAYAGTGTSTSTLPADSASTTGTWTGVLDITGYDYGTADELLVKATSTTDDVEAYNLYKQTITTVTATADRTQVPNGGSANVTVTVVDQNSNPIAGAEVRDSNGALFGDGQTDSRGRVTGTQTAGTAYYYANNTASDPYEAELGDKKSDAVTVTQYSAAPTALEGKSKDGLAFDVDEYAPGDITVQVNDQRDNAVDTADQTLEYHWVFTPFGGGAVERTPATLEDRATESATNNGEYVVPLPADYRTQSGTYELFAGLAADALGNDAIASSKVLTVKAGQAKITYDETSPESAAAGTEEVVDGQLVLEDDTTGLPGRRITLTYQRGAAGSDDTKDSGFVPATGDALVLTREVTTAANGAFSVTVDDLAETPQGTELGGNIDALGVDTPGIGNSAARTDDQVVDFVTSTPPARSTIVISDMTEEGDTGTPGRTEGGYITVTEDKNNDGVQTPVAGLAVELKVDKGFFTDGEPDPAPAEGADRGELHSLGQTITVVTDEYGEAYFETAIERDSGFDDDGLVKAIVTATAGNVSDTEDVDWSSEDPRNGGEVRLVTSPEREQDHNTLPKAPVGDEVYFDVFVTDQFGNLVGGQEVTISDNKSNAEVVGEDVNADILYPWGEVAQQGQPGLQIESDFDSEGDFYATSTREQDQTVTATWTTETRKYTDTNGNWEYGDETLTDSYTINWYEADFAASTFTISQSPEGDVKTGTSVTETVTVVDENGNPVQGLTVEFIRSGAGSDQGDPNVVRTTNAKGQAFYSFTSSSAGTAKISAVVSDGEQNKTLTDTVTFVADGKINASLTLKGDDNGGKADRLFANAISRTKGAVVTLFRYQNGGWKQIDKGTMNAAGNKRFVVADRNGNKVTKYRAIVAETEKTEQGKGGKRVR